MGCLEFCVRIFFQFLGKERVPSHLIISVCLIAVLVHEIMTFHRLNYRPHFKYKVLSKVMKLHYI